VKAVSFNFLTEAMSVFVGNSFVFIGFREEILVLAIHRAGVCRESLILLTLALRDIVVSLVLCVP
jgi:hypothetical protein